jgi:hypothetical protein
MKQPMQRPYRTVVTAVIGIGAGFAQFGRAEAQTFSSLYTSTAAKHCRVKTTAPDGRISICPGTAGLIVVITEADLRQTVSVGHNLKAAEGEPAASQTFEPFNSTIDTVEWRAAGGKPFAIIQRWHIADNQDMDKDGRPTDKGLMVVTRLPPGPVCRVAYVDIRANPDPNEFARRAADEIARGFDCGKDQVKIVGERGRAIELARD